MLNKFRENLQPILDKVGSLFSSMGLSPNALTLIGFIIAIIASIFFGLNSFQIETLVNTSIIASIMLLISGFFDVIDGSVAKITKKTSKKGAFLDSTLDKISETIIFLGIALGELANPILCIIAVSSSLLVSYTRSRSEFKWSRIWRKSRKITCSGYNGISSFFSSSRIWCHNSNSDFYYHSYTANKQDFKKS